MSTPILSFLGAATIQLSGGCDRNESINQCFLAVLLAGSFLLRCVPVSAQVRISEFMAANSQGLADEDGEFSDWIELANTSNTNVSLLNWSVTDDPSNPVKWRFPAAQIGPHGYLVIFASNKDRRVPGTNLHANFRLTASGEYLALFEPDGVTVASEFSPVFPRQITDVSYGFGAAVSNLTLVAPGAAARVFVPTIANGGDVLGDTWTGAATHEPFADGAWRAGPTGIGFAGGGGSLVAAEAMTVRFNFDAAPASQVIVDSKASGVAHPGANQGAAWVASAPDSANPPVTRSGVMSFVAAESDQIALAAHPDFNSTRGTISFWMRSGGTLAPGNDGAILFDRRTTRGDVIVQANDGRIFVQAVSGPGQVRNSFFGTASIADNRWHLITYVYDQSVGGSISIYIDGVLDKSQANGAAWSWDPAQLIELGRSHDPYWRRYQGLLDDFRFYNRVLAPSEIARLFAGDSGVATSDIATDLQAEMRGVNGSAFMRLPFVVSDPQPIQQLVLGIKYNDGFVAWINGQEVARANAPDVLSWNAIAPDTNSAGSEESIIIGVSPGLLRAGANVLALQALNVAVDDADLLLLPRLTGVSVGEPNTASRYFRRPTPGGPNDAGTLDVGPIFDGVDHLPRQPVDSEDLLVTTRVRPAFAPVASVTLNYRVMFGSVLNILMNDSGTHGDRMAGDGVWSAVIPQTASTNGQMIRYYVSALDTLGNPSRWPLFSDPTASPEYLGTVVANPAVTSRLPIYERFVQNAAAADTDSGTRAAMFFEGEFYDNVLIRQKGGTTRNLTKRSHRIDFHREHRFRYDSSGRRLRELALNAEYVDPSYVRSFLSFETYNRGGTPAPVHFPVRLQQNGAFHQLAFPNETLDTEMLERQGFDPDGALYKNALMLNIVPEPAIGNRAMLEGEKQTRIDENFSDLISFGVGLAETNTVAARRRYLFDHLDVPAAINFLALFHITQQGDSIHSNVCPYRDSNGTREWQLRPWDMNISFGQPWGGDQIYATNDTFYFCHPFFGASAYRGSSIPWSYNRFHDTLIVVPETREMYLRRLRTLMDELLQPPGAHPLLLRYETRIAELRALLKPEADLDRAKWGWNDTISRLGQVSFDSGLNQILLQYLAPVRTHYYVTHAATNTANPQRAGIPLPQPAGARIDLAAVEFNSASGNPAEDFVALTNGNPFAVDLSGWRLDGGVRFTFHPGTVIPAAGVLHVSPDVKAFRARARPPRGGENRFVTGPWEGRLSARGEPLTLTDHTGLLVYTNSYVGAPSPAQEFLRITELMFHPSLLAGDTIDAEQVEYIELKNIATNTAITLTGVRFTNGISFDFTGSAVTSLASGARVLVVRNLAAFTARYGAANVAGQYTGALDNAGERLQLVDAANEEILDFSYDNRWYPSTDGLGFSLAIVNEGAEPDAWDRKEGWRANGALLGAPGQPDPVASAFPLIVVSEALTHPELLPLAAIELHNPTTNDVNISGWFLSDDFVVPKKFRIADGTHLPAGGYLSFEASQFNNPATALVPFTLSSQGDAIWLSSGDANTNLTGYSFGEDFGASAAGVSFGRHTNSVGQVHFVAQTATSFGAANPGPRVGSIVISEIMYHPPDNADGGDNAVEEYIELRNTTSAEVPLFNTNAPANTWRLRGEVDFDLPPAITLPANGSLILVNFDPNEARQLAAFRAKHGIASSVPIFGPYGGKLDNSNGDLKLERPDDAVDGAVPYIRVDRVEYADDGPWPAAADGAGASLQRVDLGAYGNDPAHWTAAAPNPGQLFTGGNPPSILAPPVSVSSVGQQSAQFSVSASGTAPLRYQWRFQGAVLPGATNATLRLDNVRPSDAGPYSVVVFNPAGVAVSTNATLSVILGVYFSQQPQSTNARPGTSVAFRVSVITQSVATYQWFRNGTILVNGGNIAGVTTPLLTVSGAQLVDAGVYTCLLTDAVGPASSLPAELTLLIDPVVVAAPLSQTFVPGAPVTLSIAVTNTATLPVGYRLRRNGTTLPATSPGTFLLLNERQAFFTLSGTNTAPPWTNYAIVVSNVAKPSGNLSASAFLTYITDSDGDGLPDEWEATHGLATSNSADALLDFDGDGMLNGQEYVAGTDPTNALSYLKVEVIAADGSARVTFGAISNRTYTVVASETLGGGVWSKLADLPARSTNRVEQIQDAAYATNRYYRVVTPRQP